MVLCKVRRRPSSEQPPTTAHHRSACARSVPGSGLRVGTDRQTPRCGGATECDRSVPLRAIQALHRAIGAATPRLARTSPGDRSQRSGSHPRRGHSHSSRKGPYWDPPRSLAYDLHAEGTTPPVCHPELLLRGSRFPLPLSPFKDPFGPSARGASDSLPPTFFHSRHALRTSLFSSKREIRSNTPVSAHSRTFRFFVAESLRLIRLGGLDGQICVIIPTCGEVLFEFRTILSRPRDRCETSTFSLASALGRPFVLHDALDHVCVCETFFWQRHSGQDPGGDWQGFC